MWVFPGFNLRITLKTYSGLLHEEILLVFGIFIGSETIVMAKKFFQLLDVVQCGSQWKWKMCPSLKTKRIFPPNEFFGQSDSLACMYLVAVYLARVEMPSIPSGWFLMDSPWGMRECLKEIQGLCKLCLISPSFDAVQALGREWAWSRDGTGWCFRLLERFVLWLCWTCSAACGLSLAAVSRASSLVPGCGLPVGVTALVAVHGLEVCRCL